MDSLFHPKLKKKKSEEKLQSSRQVHGLRLLSTGVCGRANRAGPLILGQILATVKYSQPLNITRCVTPVPHSSAGCALRDICRVPFFYICKVLPKFTKGEKNLVKKPKVKNKSMAVEIQSLHRY